MGTEIGAPVGIRWRTSPEANTMADQQKVINLLSSISQSQGGIKELWMVPPLAGGNGMCPKFLADAIWDFQTFWKKRGVFHIADGVVDPLGHSIRQLNHLASGIPGNAPSPNSPAAPPAPARVKPKTVIPLGHTVGILNRLFTEITPWTFTSSAGANVGFKVITAGFGKLWLKSGSTDGGTIDFVAAGGSIGLQDSRLPDFNFSFSLPSMWSTGVGQIRARTPEPLTLGDLCGPMCIVSFTGVDGASLRGLSLSIYMLGVPHLTAIGNMMVPVVLNWVLTSASLCRAIGVMVGEARGADTSIGIVNGYGW